MRKTSNRIVLIIGLLGVSLFAGCGVTSTSLPSNLQQAQGSNGTINIVTGQLPDAIAGRSYSFDFTTQVGSGATLSSCSWTGATVTGGATALPAALSGFVWSLAPGQSGICTLSASSPPTPGPTAVTYSVLVTASTNSLPPKSTVQGFSITIRPEFVINQPSLADAVQGRTYGNSASVCAGGAACAQPVTTNLSATAPPTVGASTSGNGPLAVCALPLPTPGLATTPAAAQSQCMLSSPSVGAAGAASISVSVTDSPIMVSTQTRPVVPANTITKPLPLTVHPQIQLAQSLTAHWPDAVSGRAYASGSGCSGGLCAQAIYSATNGLGGYVWPSTTPSSISAITGMSCPAVTTGSATYTCSAANISAPAQTYSPSVTVTDTANTATPAAAVGTDPLSMRTDMINVNAALALASDAISADSGTLPPWGVQGRPYGNPALSCVGATACRPLTYDASGGLGPSAFPAGSYSFTGISPISSAGTGVPTGVTCAASSTQMTCGSSGASTVTAAPGTYIVTTTLNDTANSTTPSGSASSTTFPLPNKLVVINQALGIAPDSNSPDSVGPPPWGVQGRSYGNAATVCGIVACKPLTYDASGGLGPSAFPAGSYSFVGISPIPSPGVGVPAGVTCTSSATQIACGSGGASTVTATPGAYNFTTTLNDTANAATPSGSETSTTASLGNRTITINGPLALASDATSADYGTSPPNAVQKRSYGNTSAICVGTTACEALVYDASGGLSPSAYPVGTYSFTPISLIASPGAGGVPAGVACAASPSASPTQMTCTSGTSVIPLTTPAGAYTFSTTLNDTANPTTPSGLVSATTASLGNKTITVNPPLALASDAISADYGASPPNAVQQRYYGNTGATCGTVACEALIYDASGGLGPSASPVGSYSFTSISPITSPGAGGVPAGVACAASPSASPTQMTCSSGTSVIPLTTPTGAYSFTTTLNDTANAATQSGSESSTTFPLPNRTITVNAPLAVSDTGFPGGLPDGVDNRDYGVPTDTCAGSVACKSPVYTASNGLGTYTFTVITTSNTPVGSAFPTGFACAPAAPTVSTTFTCDAATIGTSAGTSTPYTPSVTVTDTANTATPSGSQASASESLTLHPALTIADTAYPGGLPDGVVNRDYGVPTDTCAGAANCKSPVYTASNGLGTYTFTAITTNNNPLGAAFPTGFACVTNGPPATTETCSATIGAGVATAAPFTPGVTASDPGNAAAPSGSKSTSEILNVHPILAVSDTSLPGGLPDGVVSRDYGLATDLCAASQNCKSPVYTAQNGLGGYSFTAITTNPSPLGAAFPTGFACVTNGPPVTTDTCSAAIGPGVTAPSTFTPSVTASDTANAATPSKSASSSGETLIVHPILAVTDTNYAGLLPDGVDGRDYGVPTDVCAGSLQCKPPVYSASTGTGLGGYSFTAITTSNTAGGSVFPTGFVCTPAAPTVSTTFTCDAATIGPLASTSAPYTPSVTVSDTANATTPSGSQPSTAQNLTLRQPLALSDSSYPGGLPDGVVSRDYGVAADTCGGGPCLPPVYTASNGLGTYTFTAITTSNAPGGGAFPSGFVCVTNGPPTTTDTCSAATIGGSVATAAPFAPTVTVFDAGNTAAPGGSKSTAGTETLNVHPILAVSDTSLPLGLPDGVVSRDYGVVTDICAASLNCKSPVYTAQNGLGGYSFTAITASNSAGGSAFPTGFACVTNGPPVTTDTCNATIGPLVTAPSTFTPSVTASDTANAAAPSKSASSSGENLTVHPILAVSDTNYPTLLPDGVVGRDYGLATDSCGGPPCKPPLYTASNGLGGYSFAAISPSNTPGSTFPTGFVCTTNGPPVTTYTCDAPPIGASAGTSAPYTPSVTVSDAANVTTPSLSLPSTAQSLTLHAALKLTPDAASADPPPLAVVNRQYGDTALLTCGASGAAACEDLIYDAAGGLGTLTFGADPLSIATPGTGVPGSRHLLARREPGDMYDRNYRGYGNYRSKRYL